MFRHYLKSALRNLTRKKMYTAINIFGLAFGLALCLTVMGHIIHETSFDDFHVNRDNIYRIECDYRAGETEYSSARVPGVMGQALPTELPEVAKAAVFQVGQITSVTIDGERSRIINEYEGAGYAHGRKLIFADPDYLNVFTFPLAAGNPNTALVEPYSVLISERAAAEYFSGENPIGRPITINDAYDCRITGILRDIPQNTQLFCNFMISYATLERVEKLADRYGTNDQDYAYVLVNEQSDIAALEGKLSQVAAKHLSPEEAPHYRFRIKPLKDIYFTVYSSPNRGELFPGGEASMIYSMAIVALFILILAIANFINLSTARAADRMREVGVRKVFGAFRSHLMKQFLGESVIIATVSMAIGMVLYEALKFSVQNMLPRQMMVDVYGHPLMLASVLGMILVVGLLAGLYPALYLSRFTPMAILQTKTSMKSSRSILRKVLVVFQFAIAIVFIFCTSVILRQSSLITSTPVGFDIEQVMLIDFDGEDANTNCLLMKNEVLGSGIATMATATSAPPGRDTHGFYALYTTEARIREERIVARVFHTDGEFLPTFGLNLKAGRNFTGADTPGIRRAIIVNEAVAKELGVTDLVGTILYSGGESYYEVVGVVEDFHGMPLSSSYAPLNVIAYKPEEATTLAMKIPPGDITGTIAGAKTIWERILPNQAFAYGFLDDEIDNNYNEIRAQGMISFILAGLAIAIACLGIFGLVSYTTAQRTKEIGIRKVLGASVSSIITMLSKEFVILIAVANVLAWPLGYMAMNDMLKWFPVRVSLGVWAFLSVALIALVFALLTTGYQSYRAATANPIDSLHCE